MTLLRPIARDEPRTEAELSEAYRIERELAARLRSAPAGERARLYPALYDEMFRRVPKHPQVVQKASPALAARALRRPWSQLAPFLRPDSVYLELGAGDCALAFEVARHVRLVYALDVSETITATPAAPPNVRLLLTDGTAVPVPAGSVDVAMSYQLMEHLHPDDALLQLRNVAAALKPGGIYLCVTPNRVSGPHDISKYFDDVATGFHLREYRFRELEDLMRSAGFAPVTPYAGLRGVILRYPARAIVACEALLGALPAPLRRRLAPAFPFRHVLGLRVIAKKSG
jgi:SAM-dependent methyltransferase